MKNPPVWLGIGCLALALWGCASEEVQTGYLTPQQSSSSSQETASASTTTTTTTSTSTESSATTAERLPPPSATQKVQEEEKAEAPPETAAAFEEIAKADEPAEKSESPAPVRKSTPAVGGKFGQTQIVKSTGSSPRATPRVRSKPAPRAVEPERETRAQDEEADTDDSEAPKRAASSGVSSSFTPTQTRVLEPGGSVKGVVVKVNEKARFVVMKFQYKAVPSVGKTLSVMRNGEKVGQIRVTKPVKPPHATADILDGEIRAGDTIE